MISRIKSIMYVKNFEMKHSCFYKSFETKSLEAKSLDAESFDAESLDAESLMLEKRETNETR